MKKPKEEILQNKINYLRNKRVKDKKKYNELKSIIRQKRRQVLAELDEMKEKVKDILRSDDVE